MYLHGLSEGDFDLAVRGLLGEEAPISASTVARLKDKWNDELAQWRARPLDDLEVVYMWVDGVYVKAGLEREKAAILVVMAALSDGRKVVVSAIPGYREFIESWSDVLRDMRRRGLECPRLVIGDGHLGSSAQRLSSGGRATLLEPQDPKRTGQASTYWTGFQSDSRTRPNSCCVPSPTSRLGQRLSGSGRSLLDGAATTPTKQPV